MIGWLLASIALGVPEPVVPPPTSALELAWAAPAECPDADELRAAIVALVGRPLAGDPERVVHVDGVVTHESAGYVLALHIAGPSGAIERSFTASECSAVVEPAVVVVAIAVDPVLAAAPSPPPPVAEPPRAEDPEPEPAAADAPAQPPNVTPARRRLRAKLLLAVRGGVDGGNLPGARGTIEAAIGARLRNARFELGAIHLFARTLPERSQPGAAIRTTAARGQGCWEPHLGALAFPTCGGVELGAISASGVNVASSATVHQLWLALFAGAGLMWAPVPRVALGVRAELIAGPLRRTFTLSGQPVLTTAVVGGRGYLALELRLP